MFQHELLEYLFQQDSLEQPQKELVRAIIARTVVPTMIIGTAVQTIIVLKAYYWKYCPPSILYNRGGVTIEKRENLGQIPN